MFTTQQLSDAAATTDVESLTAPSANGDAVLAKFKAAWPTAKMFLNNAKFVTGAKGDKIIDEIIEGGDAINGNATGEALKAAIKKIVSVWHMVRWPVNAVGAIIPGKAGKVIRAFIHIVDELGEQYPAE